jgi:hypothetical protein
MSVDQDDFDYDSILEMAKEQDCPMGDLLAMSPQNDPFFAGAPASREAGEWFARLWQTYDFPQGIHIRKIHYLIVSSKTRPKLPNGKTYENDQPCWDYLNDASRYARHLNLVDPFAFRDARNPEPQIFAEYEEVPEPDYELEDLGEWTLPGIPTDLGTYLDFDLPGAEITGYQYGQADQPFHLEAWIEKSTMNSVLVPLCRELKVNLVTAVGFQSITGVINMINRIEEMRENIGRDKPVRIFYISDFDPGGEMMPLSVARLLEFYLNRFAAEVDVKLIHIALTKRQVIEYDLPKIPIKPKNKSKKSFEERHGRGATELDALEAIHPGSLRQIVREVVEPYIDNDIQGQLDDALDEAKQVAQDAIDEALEAEQAKAQEIAEKAKKIYERWRQKQKAMAAHLDKELAPLRKELSDTWHACGQRKNFRG